jgi:hypothetical protein
MCQSRINWSYDGDRTSLTRPVTGDDATQVIFLQHNNTARHDKACTTANTDMVCRDLRD